MSDVEQKQYWNKQIRTVSSRNIFSAAVACSAHIKWSLTPYPKSSKLQNSK